MANLLSTTVNGALFASGRISVTYDTDRYQFNFLRASGSNWWVTNDSTTLGLHVNNVGDRFYFSTSGDFYSDVNGWLSTALAGKLSLSGGTMSGDIIFPDNSSAGLRNAAANAGFRLDDQYGNMYSYNFGGGYYVDATSYYFRSAAAANWMTISGGTVTATGDFRAPIFYDSQDTSYYVDPNSTSNLAASYIGRVLINYDGTDTWFRMQSGNRMRITTTGGTDFIIPNTGEMSYNGSTVIHTGNIGSYALTSLPAHTHDDRYYTESESDGRFQPLENQRVSTSSTVRFSNTYTTAWFRNDNSNTGLYNESTTMHWSSNENGFWDVSSTNTESSIRFYTGGHKSALRGYLYANSSNYIGFLNNGGNWSLRTDSARNTTLFGNLTVGQDVGYSSIYMYDSDEGVRELHCNSNRIGFLTQAGSWGAYADDSANWFATGYIQSFSSMYSPIYYDGNNSAYYGDFDATSRFSRLLVQQAGVNSTAGPALRVSKGWDNGTPDIIYDTVVIESNDVTTIRMKEADGGTAGWSTGDGNTSFTSNVPMRFYTGGNESSYIYSGQGGTLAMYINNSQKIGMGTSDPLARLHVVGATSAANVLAVDGINGRLFSVTDDLSDSLFSVNTIAGLPVIEAFADNTVKIGKYGSNSITISNSKIAINSDTVDANFPFYVGDRSTTGNRYILTNPGMGFNLADNYAQLQLYGTAGGYIDFVSSAIDFGGRIFWNGNFTISGDTYFNNSLYTYTLYDRNDTGYYLDMNGTSRLGTVNANELRSYGNTYLGDGNGDETHINDVLRVGATDSGDAHIFFGEGGSAGSDYGAHLYWDSGYTFTWYTRNAGSDTALFNYVTNDTTYLNWSRHFNMQNREINYVSQLHFNNNTRFVNNSANYLNFQIGSDSYGSIQVRDNSNNVKGYLGYFDASGFGLLNSSGSWGIRLAPGNLETELFYAGTWRVRTGSAGIGVNGNVYIDQDFGFGIVGVYSADRYQGIFAMGDAYKLAANGQSTGNLYGLAWTHTNVGGQSKAGLEHQLLVMNYGTTLTAIGNGIWTAGTITTVNHGNSSQWNTAYGWGNHASAGYQAASTAITTSNIGSQSVNYANSAGSATTATHTYRGIVEDTRGGQRTPTDYDDYRVSWEFTNQIPGLSANSTWWSAMTIQGWHDGYAAWQIIGPASSAIEDFYLRSGNNDTWNTSRRIWHNGDFSSTNVSNWNTAYGWGNHASAGYQAASTAITTSNIGSQSVSNATTAGGLAVHTGRNNEVNKIVRTDAAGYIQAGWINSDSGNMGFANRIARIQCSDDNYIRFQTLTEFKVSMGLSGKNNYSRRIDYSSDANYHVGSFGHAGISTNDVWHYGSGFYDVWAGGGTFPGSMTHIHGFNAVHYSAGAGGNGYGWQMASQYDRPGEYYARNISGGTFSSWRQFITSDNIGSQSVSYATTAGSATTAGALSSMNISQFTNNSGYITGYTETDTLNSVTTRGASTTNDITIGGLTVSGSLSYGSFTSASNYVTGADNILLKGNSLGVSGIFFESEKNGTNINHPSDFGFIQYHAYGIGGSSGEANRLVIGVSNDADDIIVLNPVNINGLVVRVGAGTTEYVVYHAGNIPTWNQNTSGNAGTATALQTGRTLTVGATGKTFDGTGNVSWSLGEIGAQAAGSYVIANGTSAGDIDADWGQSFKTFDPAPSGTPPLASPNIRTINVGDSYSRRTQLAFDYASDVAYFRRRTEAGWFTWREFIHSGNIGSQSVSYATTAGSAPNASNINPYYNVSAGVGYGLRFWGGSDEYKISMGVGGLYQYGPVTDYSIKTQMDAGSTGRGFTWGNNGVTPVAALNATSGNMQIAGTFTASNFSGSSSGTNTGDQTNISGNAATATNVAWSGVTSKPAGWLNTDALVENMEPSASAFPSGFYQSYLGAGNPTGTWFNYINVRHSNTGNGHGFQLGMSYYDTNLWFRSYQGSLSPTFSAWAYAISSLNIASQSVNYATSAGSATSSTTATTANRLERYGVIYGNNWNDYYLNNRFIVASAHNATGTNKPDPAYNYGSMMSYYNSGEDHYQIYVTENSVNSNGKDRKMYYRSGWNGSWGGWRSVVDVYNSVCYIDAAVTATGDITAFSDGRVKENVETLEGALDKTLKLRGVSYNRTDIEDKSTKIGVIAQEILEVVPEVVSQDENGMYAVSYGNITALLIEAIKEQQKQIEELKEIINGLTK